MLGLRHRDPFGHSAGANLGALGVQADRHGRIGLDRLDRLGHFVERRVRKINAKQIDLTFLEPADDRTIQGSRAKGTEHVDESFGQ